ncbi:hypothetical protein [Lignipirellula cremea]|uniref:Uncharacterized protein n=1 Tax=Lignipirellula cremea TaxID=2528010 RepID=A0A518E3Z7_9BACT|nr:hypothetical protein [Lignipirellula cremea]QDU98802.1 hypothetical protein Pla8534_66760 [Lignipirellula cremea]
MTQTDGKDFYRQMVASVRAKLAGLDQHSPLVESLTSEVLQRLDNRIEQTPVEHLTYGYWPPILGLVDTLSITQLQALDADLSLVLNNSEPIKRKELVSFLPPREHDKTGPWYGGLFDIWAKSTAIKTGLPIKLDHLLPNRRDHDITIEVDSRRYHLENTVITQDDESRAVWDRFLQDKRKDPRKVLVRPGAYCPPNAKGPSPYYDALRVYAKVYDKLAKNLNPAKSQCVDDEPNILLVSFSGLGVRSDCPSVGWVLDELFADQPKMVHALASDGITDISLDAWIDFTAKDLISKAKMTIDFFYDNFSEMMAAPRKLGGILLFDGTRLSGSRVNYNAYESSRVSHRQMVRIEEIFASEPCWWL